MLAKYLEWFKHHERLVLLVVVCVVSLMAWHKWVAHADGVAHDQAVEAQEKLKLDTEAAKVAQQNTLALQQQNLQLQAQLVTLQTQVSNAINQRNTQTSQRKQEEATAPLTVISERWSALVKAPTGGIVPSGSGVLASDAASRSTVQALEDGATAEANLIDLTALDAKKEDQLRSYKDLTDSMAASAKATQVQLQDQINSCNSTLKDERQQAKKKQRNSFIHGLELGGGIVAGLALHFLL